MLEAAGMNAVGMSDILNIFALIFELVNFFKRLLLYS